ncbi:hypothetical protein IGL98_000009 [Enterococcus sp. DIV0840]|uniref:hypothetical protein n=1 Tax=Enterococcus TaxID=1350 RepID=UPI001A8C60DC|nr:MULTISPECIES: hypothetical protein [Enterococcus]MBO0434297.1 hypothetical protein [Enterococcus sp. DIV0849a]MBO0474094.1 hypothetical protein [Enterococcus ureasiticus]
MNSSIIDLSPKILKLVTFLFIFLIAGNILMDLIYKKDIDTGKIFWMIILLFFIN